MSEAGCLEAYAPVDISEEITRDTADAIADEYEGVDGARATSATSSSTSSGCRSRARG